MDFLISLYDNSLIYFPNIFFAALFFTSVLGIVSISIGIIFLWKRIKRAIGEIKNNLEQIKKIRKEKIRKTSFTHMIKTLSQLKSIYFAYTIRSLTVSLVRVVEVFLVKINTALGHIESQAEKIAKKIEREIFIKE